MEQAKYSKEELHSMGPQRTYKSDACEAAFLLGGIGTGNISIGARGELRDWEIFNKPAKGNKVPYSFFCIWAKPYGGEKAAKVLESKIRPPYNQTHGYLPGLMAGLPNLDNSTLKGDQHRYQYGTGCLSDQLIGQLFAHVAGLGYILPEEHVKKAVKAVYNYNYRDNFEEFNNVQRAYVLNDESGLLLCSWPDGGRPRFPFVYSDEVWTGIEYQVAAHLIFEGYIDEGLSLVKTVRDRQDGYRRNPWDEVECGRHYARSLASWAVLIALSGYKYDMVNGSVSFKPVINEENFSTFWSTGKAGGIYTQKRNPGTGEMENGIEVLYGSLDGVRMI